MGIGGSGSNTIPGVASGANDCSVDGKVGKVSVDGAEQPITGLISKRINPISKSECQPVLFLTLPP